MSSPLNHHKNWSSLLLPFVAGAIITALAFSLFGGSGQSASSDLQGDVRKGTLEINPNATGLSCGKTNCDLMAKLNQMHGNGGNSTWSLSSLAIENANRSDRNLQEIWNVRGAAGNGISSWTLDGLAQQADMQANWIINSIFNNVLGNSTWTLESLAQKINGTSMDTVALLKNNGMGPSSWTLEALASQIFNVCQN